MTVLIEVFKFNWSELKWNLYTSNVIETDTDEQLISAVKNFKSSYRVRYRIALTDLREGLKPKKNKCPFCESDVML